MEIAKCAFSCGILQSSLENGRSDSMSKAKDNKGKSSIVEGEEKEFLLEEIGDDEFKDTDFGNGEWEPLNPDRVYTLPNKKK
jgi:hypothetical protein